MAALLSGILSEVSFSPRAKRESSSFSPTNYRKRSKPRCNNSRHHMRSRCITSLCASGIPTVMSLRPKKTLRRRLSMDRRIVLTQLPRINKRLLNKPALRGRLPRPLPPCLPNTHDCFGCQRVSEDRLFLQRKSEQLHREFPCGKRRGGSTPDWPMTSRSGWHLILRKP